MQASGDIYLPLEGIGSYPGLHPSSGGSAGVRTGKDNLSAGDTGVRIATKRGVRLVSRKVQVSDACVHVATI